LFGSWMFVSAWGSDADSKGGSACEKNCALNKCPKDATADVCVTTCEMYLVRCPAETSAATQSRIGLAAGKLVCDPDNQITTYADQTSCSTENAALLACLSK